MRVPSRLPVLLVLPLAIACTGASDDTGGGNGGGNPSTNGGPCGPYVGRPGTTLTYAFTDAYQAQSGVTGSMTSRFDSFTDGVATFTYITTTTSAQADSTSQGTQQLTCGADGVFLTSATSQYTIQTNGTVYSGQVQTAYDAPVLLYPPDLAEGSTWTSSYAGTNTDSNAGASDFAFTQEAHAVRTETVSVPAGTFDTLVIAYATDGGEPSTVWLDADLGAVQTGISVLASVD